MDKTGTPHNQAQKGDIAKTVLMPGDPLRAKYIAENFLDNAQCFNELRGMLGFTGYYKGKPVSVMGHGMGIPSIGIYSWELFEFYDVDQIIRVGSAGAIAEQVKLNDVVIAMGACTNSNYGRQFNMPGDFAPIANYHLLETAVSKAKACQATYHVGNVLSSDTFYDASGRTLEWDALGVLAVEMEATALYMNAAKLRKKALCILTISDELRTGIELSGKARENSFNQMIEIALETAADY